MLDIKIFYHFVRVWNELRDLTFNALSLHCRSCIFISNWFSYFGDYLFIERSKSKFDLKILKKWYELRKKYLTISKPIKQMQLKSMRTGLSFFTEKCVDTTLGWIQLKMIETMRIKMIITWKMLCLLILLRFENYCCCLKRIYIYFFAKTRTGIKHLKVFYINTMCPLCHLS